MYPALVGYTPDVPYIRYAEKEETCQSCGVRFTRAGGRRMKYCPDCKIARVMAVAAQAHYKQGAYWEKIVRGQLKRWHREARALGLDVSREVVE